MADLRVHGASVTVNAPVHMVYQLFTRFDQFPKFMKFVKEVTYLDNAHQRTHWVADVYGHDVWDAVNEDWFEDRQIGWRSTSGLKNSGKVEFLDAGPNKTMVNAQIMYDPTGGVIGEIVNDLVGSRRFDQALQESVQEFAHLVDTAPPGGLDPNSPNYVFGGNNANRQSGVSHMAQAGPVLAPGEPQDMVRQPVTGNMVDEGMTPLDLATVGGGQTPGAHFPDISKGSGQEVGTGTPGAPMTSRDPEQINQAQAVAQNKGERGRVENAENGAGETALAGPLLRQEQPGDTGKGPGIESSREATPTNEEENRQLTAHTQNAADTGHEVV